MKHTRFRNILFQALLDPATSVKQINKTIIFLAYKVSCFLIYRKETNYIRNKHNALKDRLIIESIVK